MPIPIQRWQTFPVTVSKLDMASADWITRTSSADVVLEVRLPIAAADTLQATPPPTLEGFLIALIPHMDRDDVARLLAAAVAQRLSQA